MPWRKGAPACPGAPWGPALRPGMPTTNAEGRLLPHLVISNEAQQSAFSMRTQPPLPYFSPSHHSHRWPDILVDIEKILRIVLGFRPRQPFVIITVGCANSVFALTFHHEVYVGAPGPESPVRS